MTLAELKLEAKAIDFRKQTLESVALIVEG